MFKASTGLRNAMLDSGSLKSVMDGGLIKIYAGTEPDTADDAIGGATLLCTISDNSTGDGIDFDTAAVGDTLSKAPAQTWSGVNVAAGTASFYRHVAIADDGTDSATQARIQGTVGLAGAELNLSSTALSSGATQIIQFYTVALPTL